MFSPDCANPPNPPLARALLDPKDPKVEPNVSLVDVAALGVVALAEKAVFKLLFPCPIALETPNCIPEDDGLKEVIDAGDDVEFDARIEPNCRGDLAACSLPVRTTDKDGGAMISGELAPKAAVALGTVGEFPSRFKFDAVIVPLLLPGLLEVL